MSQQKKQWGAIIVMIALFAMIAFVTNLCTPMATIIKNQPGGVSNVLAQIGNYGNFIAYLVMGIPAGMLIAKYGYKKTALIGLAVGITGILIQWYSGKMEGNATIGAIFTVYLIGAFISGLCMCILNCVVNPMLNILGGGGNKGNQLIQLGGVFNSSAAVACYILMGALIADASRSKIADVEIALMIALAIFVIAFVVICFTKIQEPGTEKVQLKQVKEVMKYRHFALGALAIFLYMGIEVGVPNFVQQYLSTDTKETLDAKASILKNVNKADSISVEYAALQLMHFNNGDVEEAQAIKKNALAQYAEAITPSTKTIEVIEVVNGDSTLVEQVVEVAPTYAFPADSVLMAYAKAGNLKDPNIDNINYDFEKSKTELQSKIDGIIADEITAAEFENTKPGMGIAASTVGMLVAVYWFMMLIGRFVGASIGNKISARKMITCVSIATIVLVVFGMFAPATMVKFPGVDWSSLEVVMTPIPMGIFSFLLVGLCTSVMWGAIFNMAVEGLGKYTAIASGIFMTMVFGCAVMMFIQALAADVVGYIQSYWVVVACAAYILFYALVGSKVTKRAE